MIYCNAFFLGRSEQTWQTCYLLVRMTISGENSYLGHIFQDLSPVHTKKDNYTDNYKDKDISVHTSGWYTVFILSAHASAAFSKW